MEETRAERETKAAGAEAVIPVVAEELRVGKRTVETGGVRVVKRVEEREEMADVPLLRETLDVRRVPLNRPVTGETPAVRYEGDTMIVPVLEEVVVVEKRLMLKEELHVTRRRETVHEPQAVTLRREVVDVERFGADPEPAP